MNTTLTTARLDDAPNGVEAEFCASQFGPANCDNVTDAELDAFADRIAGKPAILAAFVARVQKRQSTKADVTLSLLDSHPPSGLPPKAPTPTPVLESDRIGDAENLAELTTRLLSCLESHRAASLVLVTLTAPPGTSIAPLLSDVVTMGGWLVSEQTRTGQHAHGLLVLPRYRDAVLLVAGHAERNGLAHDAQSLTAVSGWRTGDLRGNLFRIAKYALKLLDWEHDRCREGPIAVTAWGMLAECDEPSRFALVTAPLMVTLVTGPRACRWCVSTEARGMLTPRQGDDAGCSAKCRKRKQRAEVTGAPCPEAVTPANAVTVEPVSPPTVTAPRPGALLMQRARGAS